jgi:PAS domain S-box-containing protein
MVGLAKEIGLATLRGNLDLLLRAQRLGKTGYIVFDAATERVYWSDTLFERRKVPPRPFFTREEGMDYIHPDDRERFLAARAKAMRDRREFELEMRILCGDGTTIWERSASQPQFDSDGRFTGLLSVIADVTESKAADASLKAQEATYRALFNSIGDAIFLTLGDVFIDCNEAALTMFGATHGQMVGHSPVEFSVAVQPDGRPSSEKAREKIAAALAGKRQLFEWRHKRVDGSEFDAEVVLSRVEDGDEPYFFGVVRDISERKAAEAALKASHDKFEGAFNSSTDAMLVANFGAMVGEGRILEVNDAARRVLGRSRDEMVGKTITEAGIMVDRPDVGAVREQLLRGEPLRDYETQLRRADGAVLDVTVNGAPFARDGEPLALITIRDITETHLAERKIRELNASLAASLADLRAITDNVPVAISHQDVDGHFRFVNRTMKSWFAATAADMVGKRVTEFVSPDYIVASEPLRSRRKAGIYRSEAVLPYPDGVKRWVEVTYVPDRDAQGTLRGFYTLAIDLTERKAAEDQLHQSQKMQAIGKLTGGVAHDFNNLLGVILGNLELASEALGPGDARIARLLEPARRAAERGSTLTKSLLSFARQQPLSPQATDVHALARDMTDLLSRTMPSNIAIDYAGGVGLWTCEVDPGQLQNALLNLVVNARDAMPDGGRLCIETRNTSFDSAQGDRRAGEYVTLSVSDTGTGMPPEVIARAFEPFYTTKGTGQGTGLGLSMVYGFAQQSGGDVTIESAPGAGTKVTLYLPRWRGAEDTAAQAGQAAPAARNETVLVAEDDEDMRLVTATMLRSLGYAVVEAATGPAALDVLAAHPEVALLVTDVVLAGSMNGRRLAQEALTRRPGIAVLYMSGYAEDAIVHQGRLEPGVRFIQKPFRKQDLANKARAALDAR